jgi:hypothetical protein
MIHSDLATEPARCPSCGRLVQPSGTGSYSRHLTADPDGRSRVCKASHAPVGVVPPAPGRSRVRVPIFVSNHAQERARRWAPEFWADRGVNGIVAEVGAALHSGRKAKTKPRWASVVRRTKASSGGGTGLFVWNREETRCYVLVWAPTRRGPGWVVKTTIGSGDSA